METTGPPTARAISIAGSDPSGGAGIQADVVTFAALGVHGMGCVTALTVQDTRGVHATRAVEPEFVAAQLEALLEDLGADALKTGMLGGPEVVLAIARTLRAHGTPALVCDPVLASTGGVSLLGPDLRAGLEALRRELLPLTQVLTPNLHEAALLLDWEPARSAEAPADTCRALLDLGPRAVILTGGHSGGTSSDDLLFDGAEFTRLSAPRIETRNSHGTGCAFSAALSAHLARGDDLLAAARGAKAFVTGALEGARGRNLGQGSGPLDLTWSWR